MDGSRISNYMGCLIATVLISLITLCHESLRAQDANCTTVLDFDQDSRVNFRFPEIIDNDQPFSIGLRFLSNENTALVDDEFSNVILLLSGSSNWIYITETEVGLKVIYDPLNGPRQDVDIIEIPLNTDELNELLLISVSNSYSLLYLNENLVMSINERPLWDFAGVTIGGLWDGLISDLTIWPQALSFELPIISIDQAKALNPEFYTESFDAGAPYLDNRATNVVFGNESIRIDLFDFELTGCTSNYVCFEHLFETDLCEQDCSNSFIWSPINNCYSLDITPDLNNYGDNGLELSLSNKSVSLSGVPLDKIDYQNSLTTQKVDDSMLDKAKDIFSNLLESIFASDNSVTVKYGLYGKYESRTSSYVERTTQDHVVGSFALGTLATIP